MKVAYINKDLIIAQQRAKELAKKWNEEYKRKAQKEYLKNGNKPKKSA